MQVSNYIASQHNYLYQKHSKKNPNFQALIMKPNLDLLTDYHYHDVISHLEKVVRDKIANSKFWDLKVISSASVPRFIIQNKNNNNAYEIWPEQILKPIKLNNTGRFAIPCTMVLPRDCSFLYFTEKLVSNQDTFDKDKFYPQTHTLYLQCDSKEDAQQTYNELSRLRRKCRQTLFDVPYPFNQKEHDYIPISTTCLDFPLYMLDTFEKASKNKDKAVVTAIQGTHSESNSGFAKVAGMNELKDILRKDVILPLQQAELYKQYGIEPANGILLYGPPGTGKTFIAESLAEESGRNLIKMDVATTESMWIGETPKNIVKTFEEAEQNAPSIVFIDEVEALAPSRSNLNGSSSAAIAYNQNVNTLLQQMNNCNERGIFVIAATNEPHKVDKALRRAGRIDKNIFVGPPDFEARKQLFKMNLEKIYAENTIDYDKLSSLTENYTAPEIKQIIIRQAALKAIEGNRRISEADILEEIKKYKPQLDITTIESYKRKGEQS